MGWRRVFESLSRLAAHQDIVSSGMKKDLHEFLAVATGALAGWAAVNSPGTPNAVLLALYQQLGSFSQTVRWFPGGEITFALFLHHVPGVLVAALVIGLISIRMGHPKILFLAILIWPAYLVSAKSITLLRLGLSTYPQAASAYFADVAPLLVAYALLYVLLFAIVAGVRRACERHNR